MGKTPFRHDRTTARDDTGQPSRGERHVAEEHAGMDREVIDALLALLNQRVAIDFPREIFRPAADLFEGLIDWHRADGYRRIANDPLPRFVDVLAGREIHDRVGTP